MVGREICWKTTMKINCEHPNQLTLSSIVQLQIGQKDEFYETKKK